MDFCLFLKLIHIAIDVFGIQVSICPSFLFSSLFCSPLLSSATHFFFVFLLFNVCVHGAADTTPNDKTKHTHTHTHTHTYNETCRQPQYPGMSRAKHSRHKASSILCHKNTKPGPGPCYEDTHTHTHRHTHIYTHIHITVTLTHINTQILDWPGATPPEIGPRGLTVQAISNLGRAIRADPRIGLSQSTASRSPRLSGDFGVQNVRITSINASGPAGPGDTYRNGSTITVVFNRNTNQGFTTLAGNREISKQQIDNMFQMSHSMGRNYTGANMCSECMYQYTCSTLRLGCWLRRSAGGT